MPRKRKTDQPSIESEPATATIEPEPAEAPVEHEEVKPSFVERLGERNGGISLPDPFMIAGDFAAGVRLFESRRDRQMAIKFDDKPDQPIIDMLKDAGYRWNVINRVWTHPIRQDTAMSTRIDAERLYQEVRQIVRDEKGIESGQDVPF